MSRSRAHALTARSNLSHHTHATQPHNEETQHQEENSEGRLDRPRFVVWQSHEDVGLHRALHDPRLLRSVRRRAVHRHPPAARSQLRTETKSGSEWNASSAMVLAAPQRQGRWEAGSSDPVRKAAPTTQGGHQAPRIIKIPNPVFLLSLAPTKHGPRALAPIPELGVLGLTKTRCDPARAVVVPKMNCVLRF